MRSPRFNPSLRYTAAHACTRACNSAKLTTRLPAESPSGPAGSLSQSKAALSPCPAATCRSTAFSQALIWPPVK
jgi:hypothetical protein